MSIRPDWDPESSCETEIGQLEHTLFVDEKVLRFEVPVEDSVCVAERDPLEELLHV